MIPFDPLIIILLTVSLNISEVNGDEVSGSYSYTPDRIDKYTQPGSYSFSGTIDKETLMLNLKAGEWISKPERVLSTDKVNIRAFIKINDEIVIVINLKKLMIKTVLIF